MPAITIAALEAAGVDFASVAEVAQILRVDPRTVRRRCADGVIPAIKIADWKIPLRWLAEQGRAAS